MIFQMQTDDSGQCAKCNIEFFGQINRFATNCQTSTSRMCCLFIKRLRAFLSVKFWNLRYLRMIEMDFFAILFIVGFLIAHCNFYDYFSFVLNPFCRRVKQITCAFLWKSFFERNLTLLETKKLRGIGKEGSFERIWRNWIQKMEKTKNILNWLDNHWIWNYWIDDVSGLWAQNQIDSWLFGATQCQFSVISFWFLISYLW